MKTNYKTIKFDNTYKIDWKEINGVDIKVRLIHDEAKEIERLWLMQVTNKDWFITGDMDWKARVEVAESVLWNDRAIAFLIGKDIEFLGKLFCEDYDKIKEAYSDIPAVKKKADEVKKIQEKRK